MNEWDSEVSKLLQARKTLEPVALINGIAELALSVPQVRGEEWFGRNPGWRDLRTEVMGLYYEYIVANETNEVQHLLSSDVAPGTRFKEVAGEAGRIAYDRVEDMFSHVDFSRCRRFVMVGCGQLPVTAVHVLERAGVAECVCLDVSSKAIGSVGALRRKFGWDALQPGLCSGQDFDYAAADIVYVANMIRGKLATVERVLATAPAHVQLIVREPYSLGRLWAESVEHRLGDLAEAFAYGAVSGHLSRDVFMRGRQPR